MGKRNRKALSAILDGGASAEPAKPQSTKKSDQIPIKNSKEKSGQKPKSKSDEDFENFLKEADPELLDFAQNDWDLSDQSDDEIPEIEKSDENLDENSG